jgi:DNA-binding MarR family transcriptional regulator
MSLALRILDAKIIRHPMVREAAERTQLLEAISNEGRRTSTRSVLMHAVIAEKLGLNESDHKCADVIAGEPHPIPAGRLAELTGLSTGAITGVLDRLERGGFIVRDHDPSDRRRVVIRSTPERAPDLSPIFLPLRDGIIAFCKRYSNEELRLILGFMRGSGQVLREQMSRLQQLGPLSRSDKPGEASLPEKVRDAFVRAAQSGVGRAVTQVAAEVAAGVAAEVAAEVGARAAAKAHAKVERRQVRAAREGPHVSRKMPQPTRRRTEK